MKARRLALPLVVLSAVTVITTLHATRATADDNKSVTWAAPAPRAKNGKKLLTAFDLMKVVNVGGPRIAPDGTRVAYTASETKTEKDKEWKAVTQIWVTPTAGGEPRQYTRGDKSANTPEWSPDGNMLAFLSDREENGERQA